MNGPRRLLAALAVTPVLATAQDFPRAPAVETMRIGRVDDPLYSFTGMNAVCPMPDGRIAAIVWKQGGTELRVFDANGRSQWKRDFLPNDYASTLAVNGDTLAVRVGTYAESRVQMFIAGRDGPIRSWPVIAERGTTVSFLPSPSGPFIQASVTSQDPNLQALERPVFQLSAAGVAASGPAFFTYVDSTPRALIPLHTRGGTFMRSATLPWSPSPAFAAGGGRVYVARGLKYEIDVLDLSGAVQRRITPAVAPTPISRAMHDAWFDEYRRGPQRNLFTDSGFAKIRALPSPANRPVIRGLFASATGELAVIRADRTANPVAGGDSVYVDILSSDGSPRATVVLPPRVVMHAFNGSEIFATIVDSTKTAGHSRERDARPMPLVQIVRFKIDTASR